MPQLMPTHEELANMPAHKRERIRRAIVRILNDVDDATQREVLRVYRNRQFGEQVRTEARQLQAALTPEPEHVTRARQHALIQAIS